MEQEKEKPTVPSAPVGVENCIAAPVEPADDKAAEAAAAAAAAAGAEGSVPAVPDPNLSQEAQGEIPERSTPKPLRARVLC